MSRQWYCRPSALIRGGVVGYVGRDAAVVRKLRRVLVDDASSAGRVVVVRHPDLDLLDVGSTVSALHRGLEFLLVGIRAKVARLLQDPESEGVRKPIPIFLVLRVAAAVEHRAQAGSRFNGCGVQAEQR